jgi:glyoxylase-like metal-dependent hydrolase (beta-lactamase superfamily II)
LGHRCRRADGGRGHRRPQRSRAPARATLDHLNTGFLAALRAAGVDRNAVDVVVNTHIHSDHVGWNTRLEDGAWVPTFPNARYLVPAADDHHNCVAPTHATEAVRAKAAVIPAHYPGRGRRHDPRRRRRFDVDRWLDIDTV